MKPRDSRRASPMSIRGTGVADAAEDVLDRRCGLPNGKSEGLIRSTMSERALAACLEVQLTGHSQR
jgi:hypothetical protein